MFATVTVASAQNVSNNIAITPAQEAAIVSVGKQYFSAILHGSAAGIEAVTTPDFKVTTMEGQVLTPAQFATEAKNLRFEYGNVMTTGDLVRAKTDGNGILALVQIQYQSHPLTPQGQNGQVAVLNVTHRLAFANVGGSWKIASDKILQQQQSNF